MQGMLKFLELTPQGCGKGLAPQTIAVKLPAKNTDDSKDGKGIAGGFAAIMAALMHLPPEQLARSLNQLDRVPMEGDNSRLVPLIDLANPNSKEKSILKSLLEGPGSPKGLRALHLNLHAPGGQFTTAGLQAKHAEAAAPGALGETIAEDDAKGALNRFNAPGRFSGAAKQPPDSSSPDSAAKQFSDPSSPASAAGQRSAADLRTAAQALLDSATNANKGASPNSATQQSVPKGLKGRDVQDFVQKMINPNKGAVTPTDKKKGGDPARPAGPSRTITTNISAATKPAMQPPQTGGAIDAPNLQQALEDASKDPQARQRPGTGKSGGNAPAKAGNAGSPAAQGSDLPRQILPAAASQWHQAEAAMAPDGNSQTQEVPAESKDTHSEIMRQIVQRMTLLTDGRQSQMQISLKPAYLGNLQLEIMTENQAVTIHMTAETHHVKEVIEHNIHMLNAELQQQGFHVQKVEVSVAPDGNPWQSGQGQMTFRQAQDHHPRQGSHRRGGSPNKDQVVSLAAAASTVTPSSYAGAGEVDFFA